ncbi:MAG TPA: NADH-quinone oxidoreductase subunit G [Mycobacteriales bacterium]|jgi:NADH-quinone oxidoreductase subunit G|nr:NADH-quinone oxidoreductase subunit G [Mycobacteriales bacterium]
MTETVTCTIDGIEITVPKNTLIIRAAEMLGIQIPRFCDHPLLEPLGACRQCIVEVEGQRKPLASCTTTVTDGMVVKTQLTSPVAEKAQAGNLEFLLLNHPLDCPVCDKGGECPLQNQTLSNGYGESRFRDEKRLYEKPIAISSQVLLDRERCVLCARCTRFSQQIAGDPFIELFERGALEQVAIYTDEPFASYFSGNTVQICPVGALTGAQYRFRARPFDLVSTPSVCEHCSSGCQQRTDWRRGKVLRRLAGADDAVNEEWNCDKGRWAFQYATAKDRLTTPLIRDADGYLVEASWSEALERAAAGLAQHRGKTGVLTGGRLTVEDAYAYSKFARVALGTDDIDFRARPHSAEERDFLAARVAGRYLETTYDDIESAPAVLLVGFEPEEESPIVFLRLRKAVAQHQQQVFTVAPFRSSGSAKLSARLLAAAPGAEAQVLGALSSRSNDLDDAGVLAAEALRQSGAVILVGERLATVAGGLSSVAKLAAVTGAKLGWVPRRAGDRGALEAGCLPGVLPGGRPLSDGSARDQVSSVWGGATLPSEPGRDGDAILQAAAAGELALVVGAIDPADLADTQLALEALENAPFVVSLELRDSAVTDRADVVLPVAPAVAKSGSYLDWEGRVRLFDATLEQTGALPDARVLDWIAEAMGVTLGTPTAAAVQAEIQQLGGWTGARPADPQEAAGRPENAGGGSAVLATWHLLLDDGRLQDGEPYLAGTRKPAVARLSATTAKEIGAVDGGPVTVQTDRGEVTLPVAVTPDMADGVVWLPTCSPGSHVRTALGAGSGDVVRVSAGSAQ